jgi:hypothetical protein
MLRKIFEHIQVYGGVGTFYDENTGKFTLYPKTIASFGKVAANRQILLDLGIIHSRNNKGIALNKKTYKQELINEILFNAGAAAGHYFDLNDMDSFNNFNFPVKSLIRKRPEAIIQIADRVKQMLTDRILDLGGTGITLVTIGKITTTRDKYFEIMHLPTITKKSRALVTKEIARVDKLTFVILRKELSNLMKVFLVSDTPLYNGFIKSLEITNEGVSSRRAPAIVTADVEVSVIHDLTEEPLEGISGKFVGMATTFTTDINGKFTAKQHLGAGLCKLVGVNFVANSFAFTLTETGYSIIIRMMPVAV